MIFPATTTFAQRPNYGKMSSLIRQLTVRETTEVRRAQVRPMPRSAQVCAFVKLNSGDTSALTDNGCEPLANFGNIYIANVPINKLYNLSLNDNVSRIEASKGTTALMDSMAMDIDALPVYSGLDLPQAYTGEGVVVGIQDIGFDLTHPNFYSSDMSQYRVKRLWDMLSTDVSSGSLPVGAEYTSREALLNYAHSRDGNIVAHGTHTLGIAAGSGYDSKYRGMAYESDICLVANATTNNEVLIDTADYYKYTHATDALGFKYLFDYAESVGEPCVISFSEGSQEDFAGDDQLYYAVLDSLSDPGRIIVSSAGNNSIYDTYFRKPVGMPSAGSFILSDNDYIYFTFKSGSAFDIRVKVYNGGAVYPITIPTSSVISAKDSDYIDSVSVAGTQYVCEVVAYPSCYDSAETAYDVLIKAGMGIGEAVPLSIEAVGEDADVEWFMGSGVLFTNPLDPTLNAGEPTHNINSPAGAPSVICAGATSYRTGYANYLGNYTVYDQGRGGQRGPYSSVGPTLAGLTKPDVMAPGTNVISSYNSFYLATNPNAYDVQYDVRRFDYAGRTYSWNCQSGTSMSSPAVAGAIALWLQAKPTLTASDIRGVFSRTCMRYDTSLTYPNNYYGYGQVDVYRGLLDILGLTGIKGLSENQLTAVRIMPVDGGQVCVSVGESIVSTLRVAVYSTSGMEVLRQDFASPASSYLLDASSLPHGVYAVKVNGGSKATTGSTLIRLK